VTNNERRRGQQPGHHDQVPAAASRPLRQRRGAAGNNLGTTIKYLRCATSGAAGNGLGTMIKYL
jgi:hypothetical protein